MQEGGSNGRIVDAFESKSNVAKQLKDNEGKFLQARVRTTTPVRGDEIGKNDVIITSAWWFRPYSSYCLQVFARKELMI